MKGGEISHIPHNVSHYVKFFWVNERIKAKWIFFLLDIFTEWDLR